MQFVGPANGYTVLNRILPTAGTGGTFRPVSLNGTVDSRLGSSGGAQGGDIWFYSPGGIITGASSRFDVGSLVLSASTLDNIDNGGAELNFTGVSQTNATVTVSAGTAINANGYVAIVAPRIEQDGNINADGSIAYVAADEAVLTINQGLFDISVGVGTSDSAGIDHNGVTTGPARSGDADNQTIYMVAVPKNQALTMLIAGSAGYAAASNATERDGTIILSAGGDVTQNQIDESIVSGRNANISISGGNLTNSTDMFADDDLSIVTGDFVGGRLFAGDIITIDATGSAIVDTVVSDRNTSITAASIGLSSGTAGIDLILNATAGDIVGSGTISIDRFVNLDATGDISFGSLTAGNTFNADAGGSISFTEANTLRSQIIFNAGGDINGGSMFTTDVPGITDSITLNAAAGNTTVGNITSAQSLFINAINIDTGSLDVESVCQCSCNRNSECCRSEHQYGRCHRARYIRGRWVQRMGGMSFSMPQAVC